MYTSEEKQKAIKLYEEVHVVTKVIQKLCYPTRDGFYKWLKELKNPSEKVKAPRRRINNSTAHPLHSPLELKLETIRRLFERGENVKLVSEEIGYSSPIIYTWKRLYDRKGANSTSEELAELNEYSLPELLKIMKIAKSSY